GVADVGHVVEVAQRVGVGERAVLAPSLDVVAALDVVQAAVLAPVGAGVDAAGAVEGEAGGVAAALGGQLEDVPLGVVAPDGLAEEVGRRLRAGGLDAHLGGAGAAVGAVDPAVGPPRQAAGDGVGVLQAEARQVDLGPLDGPVATVAVGVEE